MPGFSGSRIDITGKITCAIVVVTARFKDGSSTEIAWNELFAGAPDSLWMNMLDFVFRRETTPLVPTRSTPVKVFLDRFLQIRSKISARGYEPTDETKSWLRRRLALNHAGQLDRMDFTRYEDVYGGNNGWKRTGRRAQSHYEVAF